MMLGTLRLFAWKFKNRLAHAFRFRELWAHAASQKMSCAKCGCHIYYDFDVPPAAWARVPNPWREAALCINCYKELVHPHVESISYHKLRPPKK